MPFEDLVFDGTFKKGILPQVLPVHASLGARIHPIPTAGKIKQGTPPRSQREFLIRNQMTRTQNDDDAEVKV